MSSVHNATVNRRVRRIEKELSRVNHRLSKLAREEGDEDTGAKRGGKRQRGGPPEGRVSLRDERFAEYLASNVGGGRPLRREKRLQRNKAIFMVFFVGVILLWIALHYLL